jgi:hypothetical protein
MKTGGILWPKKVKESLSGLSAKSAAIAITELM